MKKYVFAFILGLPIACISSLSASTCGLSDACAKKPIQYGTCEFDKVCAENPPQRNACSYDSVRAENPLDDVSLYSSIAFESEYVFRGAKLAQKNIQSNVELNYALFGGTYYLGAWHVAPFETAHNQAQRLDLFTGYSYPLDCIWEPLYINAGFRYYYYPNVTGTTKLNRERELHIGLGADILLEPTLFAYYNFDRSQFLLEATVNHSFDLENRGFFSDFTLDINAHAAYLAASDYTGNQHGSTPKFSNDFVYGGIRADLVYHFNEFASMGIGPRFVVNGDDNNALGANALGKHSTMFWWGMFAAFSF